MHHVCTQVPHLDLVDFGQNVSIIARLMVSCTPVKKNSNCLTLCTVSHTFSEMCPISVSDFFFIFTLHDLRQTLDWPLISILTYQPITETYSSPLKKIMSSQFKRKLLITQILKRWLLVAKNSPYKFPNNIVDPSCHKLMICVSAQKMLSHLDLCNFQSIIFQKI